MNVLTGISSIDAAVLVRDVRRQMKGCDVRYISLLKCFGRYVSSEEAAGFSLPLHRCKGPFPAAEIHESNEVRGHAVLGCYGRPPPHIYVACAVLRQIIREALASFRPDLVLIIDSGSIVSRYLDAEARVLGIPIFGLHVLFASDLIFLLPDGIAYPFRLRRLPLGERVPSSPAYHIRSDGSLISACNSAVGRRLYWLSAKERLLRLVCGYPTFTSAKRIAGRICKSFLPEVFAGCQPLTAEFDSHQRFVLVLLHHPHIAGSHQRWMDLIAFSLAAVPEDCRIVLRPHPCERNRERLPAELLQALRRRGVLISRPDGPPLPDLLRHAHAVLTLSSSAGIDALKSGTMVFTYGPSFYTRAHLAEEVGMQDAAPIRARLARKKKIRPDQTAVTAFTEQLIEAYGVPLHDRHAAARQIGDMLLMAGQGQSGCEPMVAAGE